MERPHCGQFNVSEANHLAQRRLVLKDQVVVRQNDVEVARGLTPRHHTDTHLSSQCEPHCEHTLTTI